MSSNRGYIPVPEDKTDAKEQIEKKAEEEKKAMWEVLDEVFGSDEDLEDPDQSLEETLGL